MPRPNKSYPFDEFPHVSLSFDIPRKRVLNAILSEALTYGKSIDGGDVLKLSQLGMWSDER